MFKSAGSHAGSLKGLREASWCLQQMYEKSLLGEYSTALLHSPICTLNFHLSLLSLETKCLKPAQKGNPQDAQILPCKRG